MSHGRNVDVANGETAYQCQSLGQHKHHLFEELYSSKATDDAVYIIRRMNQARRRSPRGHMAKTMIPFVRSLARGLPSTAWTGGAVVGQYSLWSKSKP